MAGILDRRSSRFMSGGLGDARRSNRLDTVARITRDEVNRSERVHEKVDSLNNTEAANKIDKDDFLLTQIDEFRERAKRLQEMLNTKESKAEELSSIVEEREAKAEELQQILDERQEKADGITAQVAKQIDVLIASVHEKMQEIETSMNANMDNLGRSVSGDMNNLGRSVSSQIGNLGQSLGTEISGDIYSVD